MTTLLTPASRKAYVFLSELLEQGLLDWPVDFEIVPLSLENSEEELGYWFSRDDWNNDGSRLLQFGSDVSVSFFCLWFYPGLTEEPPVVYLGSGGEICLVADCLQDFVRQLASGFLFAGDRWRSDTGEEPFDWTALQQTVEQRFGTGERDPEVLMEKARQNHPDFVSWAESRIA